MLKQLWNKFKTFWFSFGELREPGDYFYLKDGAFRSFGATKFGDTLLTQREIQQLRSLIRHLVKDSESDLKDWKSYRNQAWSVCDASKPETSKSFEALNAWNDIVRDEKANLKKLVNLQTKLKRLKVI